MCGGQGPYKDCRAIDDVDDYYYDDNKGKMQTLISRQHELRI
jgi:hypothetical protein